MYGRLTSYGSYGASDDAFALAESGIDALSAFASGQQQLKAQQATAEEARKAQEAASRYEAQTAQTQAKYQSLVDREMAAGQGKVMLYGLLSVTLLGMAGIVAYVALND